MCIIRLTSALASRNAPCSHLDWFPSEETIQSIVRWLKARNPYQSLLLESACNAADSLSRLNSAEFSGLSQPWSRELRKLIVHTSSGYPTTTPFSRAFSTLNNSVIILGEDSDTTHSSESPAELSVAQKQYLRSTALIEFNQKITREMLNIFNMQATTFRTAQELRNKLKIHGPFVINGYYGKTFYIAPPHLLKDQNGTHQALGTRKLLGWNTIDVKQAGNIDPSLEHMIILIGIKYNSENPNQSRIFFIDPTDSSFPNEQRTVYSMGFERLWNNRSAVYRDYFTAHYSTSANLSEKIYKQETQKKQTSTTSHLLRFGLIASIGVAAAGAVYTAYNSMRC